MGWKTKTGIRRAVTGTLNSLLRDKSQGVYHTPRETPMTPAFVQQVVEHNNSCEMSWDVKNDRKKRWQRIYSGGTTAYTLGVLRYTLWWYQGIYSGGTRVYTLGVPGCILWGYPGIYPGDTRVYTLGVPGYILWEYPGIYSKGTRVYTLGYPGIYSGDNLGVPGYQLWGSRADILGITWYIYILWRYPSIYPGGTRVYILGVPGHVLWGTLVYILEAAGNILWGYPGITRGYPSNYPGMTEATRFRTRVYTPEDKPCNKQTLLSICILREETRTLSLPTTTA